jgi:peptide/nickel transport system substrate-binding protein
MVRGDSRRARAGRRTAAVLAVVTVATLATAITAASVHATPRSAPRAGPQAGGSIVYGLESETGGGWCPTTARLAISGIMVATAVYDPLTTINDKGDVVPYLAKSVTHDPTYTKWTITLRDQDIRFHDGTLLTADVVKQNIDTWRRGQLLSSVFADVSDVTVDGPKQVTVTTARPWVTFDGYLFLSGRGGMVARAQLADDPSTCATNLIGTGPFKFDHWTVNQELVVTRNPDYWQTDARGQRLPYLDKITFRPVPEANQRVNALRARELDVIHTSDGQQISTLLPQRGQFNLMYEKPGRREVRYYLMNVAKPPLDDITARKAVAMAIDRNQINQIVNAGEFQIADGPFDRNVLGYVAHPGYPKTNLKRARALVAQYKKTHDGQFNVVLEHANDPTNTAEAQLIKEQLAKAGIGADFKSEDQTAFIQSAVGGNFSIMLWRNHPGDDPDGQYVWWNTGSLVNFGKIADPKLQTLLDEGRTETDSAKRKGIYQKIDRRFATQVYNIWAYNTQWLIGAQENVHGLAGPPLPDGGGHPSYIQGRHPLLGLWVGANQ